MNRHASIGYWPGESGILPGEAWLGWSRHGFPAGGRMPAPEWGTHRMGLASRVRARNGGAMHGRARSGAARTSRSAANPITSLMACSGLVGRCCAGKGTAWIPSGTDKSRANYRGQARHGNARLSWARLSAARIPCVGDNRRTKTIPPGLARLERPGDAWRVQVWSGMARMPPHPANGGTNLAVQCRARHGPARPGKDSNPSG
jgi:hypothetical protein